MSDPLKRWRFDSEYHEGLVEDQTGAWYYAADVEAWLKSQRRQLTIATGDLKAMTVEANMLLTENRKLERRLFKVTSEKQSHMDCINLLAKHIGRLGETSHAVVDAAIQQLAAVTQRGAR